MMVSMFVPLPVVDCMTSLQTYRMGSDRDNITSRLLHRLDVRVVRSPLNSCLFPLHRLGPIFLGDTIEKPLHA